MKIAIFSDNFYPEISGISDSIIEVSKNLAKRGHYINVYVPYYSKKDYEFVNLPFRELEIDKKVRVIRLKSFPFKTGTGQGRAAIPIGTSLRHIKKFKPDVIHVHSPFGAGIEAVIASRIFRIPLIGTNHTYIQGYVKNYHRLGNLFAKYYSYYYNRCRFISSPSKTILDGMKRQGLKIPANVVPNPVNFPVSVLSKKKKQAIREKYGLSRFNTVYCGRLSDEKNIDVIIKAVSLVKKKIPEITLTLIGKGISEDKLRALSKELGVESSVRFLGFLNKKEIADIYKISKVFVITSTVETQCLAAMHAMANSLPVIGVKASALPEYINNKNGFLVNPGDYRSIAEKIELLFKNPKKQKELGEGGKRFVMQFSASKIAKIWEDIYEKYRRG